MGRDRATRGWRRRIRRLVVLVGGVSAVLGWRERQITRNTERHGPGTG